MEERVWVSKKKLLNQQMSPENQWLEDIFPIEIVPLEKHIAVVRGVFVILILSANVKPCDSLVSPLLFQSSFQNTHTQKKMLQFSAVLLV